VEISNSIIFIFGYELIQTSSIVTKTRDYILLSKNRDSHSLEGQDTVFMSLRNRVAYLYLYPPSNGNAFRRLLWPAGLWWKLSYPPSRGRLTRLLSSLCHLGRDSRGSAAYINSCTFVRLFFAHQNILWNYYLAMAVFDDGNMTILIIKFCISTTFSQIILQCTSTSCTQLLSNPRALHPHYSPHLVLRAHRVQHLPV
jgi:hypothetical protein